MEGRTRAPITKKTCTPSLECPKISWPTFDSSIAFSVRIQRSAFLGVVCARRTWPQCCLNFVGVLLTRYRPKGVLGKGVSNNKS